MNYVTQTDETKKTINALKDIAIAATGSFDLDSLLQNIVETCVKLSNASRGALFLYDENTQELLMRAEKGNVPGLKYTAKYSVKKTDNDNATGLTPYIFLSNELLILNRPEDIIKHPAHIGKYDKKQSGEGKCQWLVGIPLRNPKTQLPIGVLKVENTIDREPAVKFSPQEAEILSMIADIATPAILKFQYRSSKIKESTNRLSKVLKGTEEPLEIKLREIVSVFKDITKADGASIWLKEGSRLVCRSGVGHYEKLEGKASYDLTFDVQEAKKVGLTAWIAKSGEFINIKSNKELIFHPQHRGTYDKTNYPDKEKCESFIGAPLKFGDNIIGVIKADNRIPDEDRPESFFTDEEAQVFSYLTAITATVVQNHQDFEKARTHDKQLINLYDIGTEYLNIDQPTVISELLLLGLTHGDGAGFNRAMLFEYDERESCLTGKMAVGQRSYKEGISKQKQFYYENAPSLNECINKIKTKGKRLDSPKLQAFVESQKIKLSVDCSLYKLVNNEEQPKYDCLRIDEETSPDLQKFLNEIESIKVNKGKFFAFSFQSIDGQVMVGLCDFVYSPAEFSDFRIKEAQTFVNQVSLAVSRLNLKMVKDQELQRREEQSKRITNVLANLTSAVAGKFEMQELLNQTLKTTMAMLDAEACSIFLRKEDNPNVLICKAGTGYAEDIIGATYKIGEGLTGTVALTGNFQKIDTKKELDEYKKQGLWKGKYDDKQWKGDKEFRNLLALPLIIENEIFGVIKVENKQETKSNYFSDDDLSTFQIIATVIALAIRNVISQKQKEQQTQAVRGVVSEIAGELDLKKLLDKITNTVMENFHAEVISIFIKPDDNHDIIECVAAAGYAKKLLSIPRLEGRPASYEIGYGFTGAIAKTGEEFNIRNKEQFNELTVRGIWKKEFNLEQFGDAGDLCRNIMALPLRRRDDIFGVIKVENKIKEYGENFSEDDFDTFKTIANTIALVIENAKFYKQTEKQLKAISAKAAHRINNQVTNFDYIELVLQREASQPIPDQAKLVSLSKQLGETAVNLKRMISELKRFGRPIELRKTPGDINKVIQDEVQNAQLNSTVKINLQTDSSIPEFKLDVARFAESIKELLQNAKVAIDASNAPGNIDVSTWLFKQENVSEVKNFVKITIEDNGPGIPDGFPVFEPFHSIHTQGTGLGLATVKELVNAHGGTIELIRKKEGRGACFEIHIPIER